MTKFYGWPAAGSGSASALTGRELAWWLKQANAIVERANERPA